MIIWVYIMDVFPLSLWVYSQQPLLRSCLLTPVSSQGRVLLTVDICSWVFTFLVYFHCIKEVLGGETFKGCLAHVGSALRSDTGHHHRRDIVPTGMGSLENDDLGRCLRVTSSLSPLSHPSSPTPCYDATRRSYQTTGPPSLQNHELINFYSLQIIQTVAFYYKLDIITK